MQDSSYSDNMPKGASCENARRRVFAIAHDAAGVQSPARPMPFTGSRDLEGALLAMLPHFRTYVLSFVVIRASTGSATIPNCTTSATSIGHCYGSTSSFSCRGHASFFDGRARALTKTNSPPSSCTGGNLLLVGLANALPLGVRDAPAPAGGARPALAGCSDWRWRGIPARSGRGGGLHRSFLH